MSRVSLIGALAMLLAGGVLIGGCPSAGLLQDLAFDSTSAATPTPVGDLAANPAISDVGYAIPAVNSLTPSPRDAGRTLYLTRCAACHRLGAFDPDGYAADLAGQGSRLTADMHAVAAVHEFTLTPQEIANLQSWIAAN